MLGYRFDARDETRAALDRKTKRCADLLNEARWLVLMQSYGSVLHQLIDLAYEAFDEIDEVLIALDPLRDHRAFASVAALHRQFQEIQSSMARMHRRHA